jgi:trehalose synthase
MWGLFGGTFGTAGKIGEAMPLTEIDFDARSIRDLAEFATESSVHKVESAGRRIRKLLNGRVLWNVNSTATGGGVAEMLRGLLPYVRGEEVDCRWLVISAGEAFFRITKRLHHALHGSRGDGSPLGAEEQAVFEGTAEANFSEMMGLIQQGDLVLLHDPQTAALVQRLTSRGVTVIWRCHIGADTSNGETELGWSFLRPYLASARAAIFSRPQYIPAWLRGRSGLARTDWTPEQPGSEPGLRVDVIRPSIDPLSPKNQLLSPDVARDILSYTGIVEDRRGSLAPVYHRQDGSLARVSHYADVIRLGCAPTPEEPLVVQVSRWDPLKDPGGVMRGFVEYLSIPDAAAAHLVLAGPSVRSITDDPEQPETMDQLIAEWRSLPHHTRSRIHLVNLPMADLEENAAIVNALQRHAAVVVQKSLREGFGLTVTEAMWKARPVLASAVGGILDQIQDGVNGRLVQDPRDFGAFARILHELLSDPKKAEELGVGARKTVTEHFLPTRHLLDLARCIQASIDKN